MLQWNHRTAVVGSACLLALMGCKHQSLRLEYGHLRSQALGRQMGYGIYLPPNWDGRQQLPLVVFLHGGGDDERCLDRYRVISNLDSWILSGQLEPFIMVVPDGERGFWRNWYDGSRHYEDYVVDDIIPRVRELYPALPGREHTHLMGISMGGAGALYLALDRPDVFSTAAAISAPIYDTDQVLDFLEGFFWRYIVRVKRIFGPADREFHSRQNVYTRIQGPEDLHGLTLLIGVGNEDRNGLKATTDAFHEHLKRKSVPHRYLVYQGGHRWQDWQAVFPVVLCKHLAGPGHCELIGDDFYELREFP
jgi:enterochelin esterase-like enzyme